MTSHRVDAAAYEHAKKILCANLPPRYFVLDQLERYVKGTQYEHLAPWTREDLPLFERAPNIQYPIVARSIDSNADLCLGEGHWPVITSNPGEDDTAFDERLGLSEDESALLDRGVRAIAKNARLQSVSDELLCDGQGKKTAVAVGCIRDGKLCVEAVAAKHCTPEFMPERPSEVAKLTIQYPYIDEWFNAATKKWEARVKIYRRVIDAQTDITYEPVVANETGEDVNASVWREKTVINHCFGFCPVVWYPFMRKTCDANDIDGVAVHQYILDEVDGLNYSLSMKHRAALYSGDPQVAEIGVEEGGVTAPMGRDAAPIAQPGDHASMQNYRGRDARGQSGFSTQARARGAGVIWRYENPQAKVEYLTLPGDALKTLADDADAMLNMLREALAYVSIDPMNAKLGIGDLSGKALEWFHKKQTDRCNKIREDFGEKCLLPIVNMLLRMVYVHSKKATGDALFLPGIAALTPILAKFEQAYGPMVANENGESQQATRWFNPHLRLIWGPFFPATAADAKSDIDMTIAAHDAGFITLETAVQKIAQHFPSIEDAKQYLEALKKEKAEKMGEMHDAQAALMNAGQPMPDDDTEEQGEPEEQPVKPEREVPQRKQPAKKQSPQLRKRVKRAA